MENSKNYGLNVEHTLRKVFSCERFGFGGIVDADFIQQHPYMMMVCGLTYLAPNSSSEKRDKIEKFINDFSSYSDISMDNFLSSDINEESGEIVLQEMIQAFREVVDFEK